MGTGVWGTWAIRPTGDVGYRGYEVQGYGVQGYGPHGQQATMGTGGMGYRGYGATWGMGHMGNGAHGPWGTWAMGHMGNWHIIAFKSIITGWILTKILLDIDIDVFYLNTGQFFHDGLN